MFRAECRAATTLIPLRRVLVNALIGSRVLLRDNQKQRSLAENALLVFHVVIEFFCLQQSCSLSAMRPRSPGARAGSPTPVVSSTQVWEAVHHGTRRDLGMDDEDGAEAAPRAFATPTAVHATRAWAAAHPFPAR